MDWKAFFDRLGMNGTWWQWRIMRLEQRWTDWRAARRDNVRHVAYRHKFCSRCGGLMDQADTACPRCGASAPSWLAQVMRRTFGLVLPRWAPVSYGILFANFVNFIAMMILFGGRQALMPEGGVLNLMGALNPHLFFHAGEYERLITYGYLHAGLLHIAFNMLALAQVGTAIEEEVGGARFFSIYTLCLIGGGVADLLIRGPEKIPIVGASGALFGLIGFGFSFSHFYGGPVGRAQRGFFLHWAVYGFAFGYVINADNICHLGGFLTGAVLGFLVERERKWTDHLTPVWRVIAIVLGAATIAAVWKSHVG